MNLARIMVGFQGLGQMELATQNALRYALDRKQPKPIIDFPDVRRMILHMKALTEGARVMAYETAMYVDIAHHHPDAAVREEANDWVELNTPLVKAFCTDSAVDLGSLGIQVFGGHGFIAEWGMEQILRDSKILCLYEGTNGIQAMDLVRRKLFLNEGRLPHRFFAQVKKALADSTQDFITAPLAVAVEALEASTNTIQATFKASPNAASFGCCDYQRAFALTYLGYGWLRMVEAVQGSSDEAFKAAKMATAHYFASRVLTSVPSLLANAALPADDLMHLPAASLAA
jgi:hypothetical protein